MSFAVSRLPYILDRLPLIDYEHPFQMITVILTAIGPASDFDSFGRWPLLVSSLIYWGSMFSTITLTCKLQLLALRIP